MSWAQAVAAAREAAKAYFNQRIATLFGWTIITNTSELGDKDRVQNEDGGTSDRPAQRVEPFGLRWRAPAATGRVRSLWIRLGASNVFLIGIRPTAGYGPADIGEGEVALYSKADGCTVYLNGDGAIVITPTAGQLVTIAGGTKGVARLDDAVTTDISSLQSACDQRYVRLGGSPPITNSVTGTISSASTVVKSG